MNCEEVQSLAGPYLDSELETRVTLEIEQHLKSCASCARVYALEEKFEARLKAGLSAGNRSDELWGRIEKSVVNAAAAGQPRPTILDERPGEWLAGLRTALGRARAGWNRAPLAWSGLSLAWVLILALNFASRESGSALAQDDLPSASAMRFALEQKQLLMGELAAAGELVPTAGPKTVVPGPRSDRIGTNYRT